MSTDWETTAAAKRQSVLDLIPQEWRLENVPSAEEQKDVTGSYTHQFLSAREIEITETDAVGLTAHLSSGKLSAVEVTQAFCHRASIAHQLVGLMPSSLSPLIGYRSTVCTRYFSIPRLNKRGF